MDQLPSDNELPEHIVRYAPWLWERPQQLALAVLLVLGGIAAWMLFAYAIVV